MKNIIEKAFLLSFLPSFLLSILVPYAVNESDWNQWKNTCGLYGIS